MSFSQLPFDQRLNTPNLTVNVIDLGFDLRKQMLKSQLLFFKVFALNVFHKHYVFGSEIKLMSFSDTHGLSEVLHNLIRFMEQYSLESVHVSELILLSLSLVDEELVAACEGGDDELRLVVDVDDDVLVEIFLDLPVLLHVQLVLLEEPL